MPSFIYQHDIFTYLLLHMEGSDGGTSFLDSHRVGLNDIKTMTAANATTSTSQKKFGSTAMRSYSATNAASYIYTSNAYILADSGGYGLTFEFWLFVNSVTASKTQYIYYLYDPSDGEIVTISLSADALSNVTLSYKFACASPNTVTTSIIAKNTWHHVCIRRTTDRYHYYLHINGSDIYTMENPGGKTWYVCGASNTATHYIGAYDNAWAECFIDEFRICSIDRFATGSGAFVVPTVAYS